MVDEESGVTIEAFGWRLPRRPDDENNLRITINILMIKISIISIGTQFQSRSQPITSPHLMLFPGSRSTTAVHNTLPNNGYCCQAAFLVFFW